MLKEASDAAVVLRSAYLYQVGTVPFVPHVEFCFNLDDVPMSQVQLNKIIPLAIQVSMYSITTEDKE